MEQKRAARLGKPQVRHSEVPLANKFSDLNVEGGQEEEDTNREDKKALDEEEEHLPPVIPIALEQDEAAIESEFFLTTHDFLHNLSGMREVIKSAWKEYLDGRLELVSVALFMNTAIDLVRHAEGELDISLTRPRKYADTKKFPVWTLPALLYVYIHPQVPDVGDRINDEAMLLNLIKPTGLVEGLRGHQCTHVDFTFWPVYSGMRYYVWSVFDYKRPKMYAPRVDPSHFDPVGGVSELMLRA